MGGLDEQQGLLNQAVDRVVVGILVGVLVALEQILRELALCILIEE